MEPSFWQERWQSGQIGFHEGAPNRFLARYMERLRGEEAAAPKILVPLCGKAIDLVDLATHGFEVVGVEFVPEAIDQFFDENRALGAVSRGTTFGMPSLAAGAVTLVRGDIFAFRAPGHFDAVYDRAALVALKPADRKRYIDVLANALRPQGRILLVTFEYDATKIDGPPFSVESRDVESLFTDRFEVSTLASEPAKGSPRMQAAGIPLLEHAWWLARRA